MERSSSSLRQNSFTLNPIEATVLEQILVAANDQNALSPQRIADQVPYSPETVSAAIDKLLTMGLVEVTVNDEFLS